MKHSIRKNFTLIFIALVAALLLIMCVIFSFFIQKHYRNKKIQVLESAYDTLESSVKYAESTDHTFLGLLNMEYDSESADSEIVSEIRSLIEGSNIDLVLIDSTGLMMASASRESDWNTRKLRAYIAYKEVYGADAVITFPITGFGTTYSNTDDSANDAADDSSVENDETSTGNAGVYSSRNASGSSRISRTPDIEVLKSTENYRLQLFNDSRSNTEYLECWGVLSDGDTNFLMTMPIASIAEGATISRNYLVGLSCIILVVGAFAVYFTTGRITRPINDLAHLSERMSALDFSVRYTGGSKDEIGVLGDSMNVMSEKLEQTINDLRAANAKLQEDIELKERVDEMRKEFIADVSHELKTPIALIQGYAEGLTEGLADDPESRAYYCGVIMDEADKMNHMVRQLTSLISYEFGEDVYDKTDFNLSELVKNVADSMSLRIAEKEAELILDVEPGITVNADAFKIEEAITNYLSNAVNHVEGKKRIRVSLKSEGDRCVVRVYNDGQPIPEESIGRLWEKFYKVDKARTRAYGGSGIGLSIVKAIIENHGGTYGVSNLEDGVEFYFSLLKNA